MQLAQETGTPLHTWNGASNIYDENGELLDSDRADRFSDVVWQIVGEALEFSEKSGDEIPETMSLYDFFAKRAAEMFPDQQEDQKLLLNMSQVWGAYIGHPVDKQSLRFAWMEKCCVGGMSGQGRSCFASGADDTPIDEVIAATTYTAILQKVAQTALSLAEIKFNTKVVGIEAPKDARDEKRSVVLRTDDGCEHLFDEVILTTPLGWLKRNKDSFTPSLPPRLSQAIDNISVGHLEKVNILPLPCSNPY